MTCRAYCRQLLSAEARIQLHGLAIISSPINILQHLRPNHWCVTNRLCLEGFHWLIVRSFATSKNLWGSEWMTLWQSEAIANVVHILDW
jgi:hypothetical protein